MHVSVLTLINDKNDENGNQPTKTEQKRSSCECWGKLMKLNQDTSFSFSFRGSPFLRFIYARRVGNDHFFQYRCFCWKCESVIVRFHLFPRPVLGTLLCVAWTKPDEKSFNSKLQVKLNYHANNQNLRLQKWEALVCCLLFLDFS